MSFIQKYMPPELGELTRMCDENNIPLLLSKALYFRGIRESGDIFAFLNPDPSALHDPFMLPDMKQAVERLKKAITDKERVCVYGDYDADGICASAILLRYLNSVGADVFYHLPSRFQEGYGMNKDAIEAIAKKGAGLIVTVDNGVTALEEIRRCNELGIDVVVTDHHQCLDELPKCIALVNAQRADSAYPFKHLCGAGVALKLVQAMGGDINDFLALAALATVADVVPLTGENRVIVALGQRKIEQNAGLCELAQVSGTSTKDMDSDAFAFRLAPRLNAAGRMGDPCRALDLLMEDDAKKAHELALVLNDENIARQREEQRIYKEAEQMLEDKNYEVLPALMLYCEDWNPGVIGIVASKLVEKYYKPALLFHLRDGILTGSCRSIQDVDIFKCISACSGNLLRYGGHAQAAGLTLKLDDFEAFKDEIYAYLSKSIPPEAYIHHYHYEMEAKLSDFSMQSIASLSLLAPYGEGNPRPVFLTRGVRLNDVARVGSARTHVKAYAVSKRTRLPLVAFGFGGREDELSGEVDILYTADIHNWMDQKKIQLQLCAVENKSSFLSEKQKAQRKFYDDFFSSILYNIMNNTQLDVKGKLPATIKPVCMSREEMLRIYKEYYTKLSSGPQKKQALVSGAEYDKKTIALLVFLELGFLGWNEKDETIKLILGAAKRELSESKLYSITNMLA